MSKYRLVNGILVDLDYSGSRIVGGQEIVGSPVGSGGLSAIVNQVTETDTAQAVTVSAGAVSATVAQVIETDTAQAVTAQTSNSVTVSQVSETDTAQPVSASPGAVIATVSQVIETNIAQSITVSLGGQIVNVDPVVESDAAQTVTAQTSNSVTVSQASESDTAQPITATPGAISATINQAAETDLAQSITASLGGQFIGIGQVTGTETAFTISPLAGFISATINQVTETDSAQPIGASLGGQLININQAIENDSAQPITALTGALSYTLNIATETDLAQSITVAGVASIALLDYSPYYVVQRDARSGSQLVTFGGIIVNGLAVEARITTHVGATEVVGWTDINASIDGDDFIGQLSVPEGGFYNVAVRIAENPAIQSVGVNPWGVGVRVVWAGQSDSARMFSVGSTLAGNPLLVTRDIAGWSLLDGGGDGAIQFGNDVISGLGGNIPVALYDFGVGSSALVKEADKGFGYWRDTTSPGSIYDNCLQAVLADGGSVECFVFWQSGTDAYAGVDGAQYEGEYLLFIDQVRRDMANASTRDHLPWIGSIRNRVSAGNDSDFQSIRSAQWRVLSATPDAIPGGEAYDLTLEGVVHLDNAGNIVMGQRYANAFLFLQGLSSYYIGPELVNWTEIDDTTTDLLIRHYGGNSFTPNFGISGFLMFDGGGDLVTINSVFRVGADIVRVRHDTLTGARTIRHMYGATPDASAMIHDNSPLALPLSFSDDVRQKINEPGRTRSVAGGQSHLTVIGTGERSVRGLPVHLEVK